MRTSVLGALLVTPLLIFASTALGQECPKDPDGILLQDTISITDRLCAVTGYEEIELINEVTVTATGGVAIVKIDKRKNTITAKCQITGLSGVIFLRDNPETGFACCIDFMRITELNPPDGGATSKKRMSKKGTVQLQCSGPYPN